MANVVNRGGTFAADPAGISTATVRLTASIIPRAGTWEAPYDVSSTGGGSGTVIVTPPTSGQLWPRGTGRM